MLTGNNAKNGLTTVVYNMLHDASNYVLDTTHKQSFTLFALLPTKMSFGPSSSKLNMVGGSVWLSAGDDAAVTDP